MRGGSIARMSGEAYGPTDRTTLHRLADRGAYDAGTVHAVLDAAYSCSVGYVVDGRPHVTPTAHWRVGRRLYWHGSSASAFLRQVVGREACLSVHLLDGLVLARSGFEHSMNYRSVTVFGTAQLVEGDEKLASLDAFVERLVPGRSRELRRPLEQELKATTVLAMDLVEASAKVRTGGMEDRPEDLDDPVWAGIVEIEQRITRLVDDPDHSPGAPPSEALRGLVGRVI